MAKFYKFPQGAVEHLSKRDKKLGRAMAEIGPIKAAVQSDPFKSLASSIVSQQISGRAAESIWNRLEAALGGVSPESVLAAADEKIRASGLYEDWELGKYAVGDIRNAKDQTWECFQAHDNATYPDINPDNAAWYTFWRPLHGKTPETARPFVPVQGAHDMYRVGEYMIWTDGEIYECLRDTNYSPEDYAADWKKYAA